MAVQWGSALPWGWAVSWGLAATAAGVSELAGVDVTERWSLKLRVRLLRAKLDRALEDEEDEKFRSVLKLKSRSVSDWKMPSSSGIMDGRYYL